MAKPKSEQKRLAILDAAVREFATRGVESAPTSAISASARVAEGTLFTYYATKDELINAVYRQLKQELAYTLFSSYPKAVDARVRFAHIWQRYVRWGLEHPQKFHVLAQLDVSDRISAESRSLGTTALAEIDRLARDSIRRRRLHNRPTDYLASTFSCLAGNTIAFASRATHSRFDFVAAGFDIFWSGVASS